MRTLFLAPLAMLLLPLASAQVANTADSYPYVFRTFAGRIAPVGDGVPATQAYLRNPLALAFDSAGNLFILDASNRLIRKMDSLGNITTVFTLSRSCTDMAIGRDGRLYLASSGLIFRIETDGTETPIAGTGAFGSNGGEGVATLQPVGSTAGIALDHDGNVYFVDGSRVRKVTIASGRVSTVAGTGSSGYNGDNRPAATATLNSPRGIALDGSGTLFISEYGRIRKVTNGTIQTLAGSGVLGRAVDGAPANATPLGQANRLIVDSSGVVYFTESTYGLVMKVTPLSGSSFSTLNWVAGCPAQPSFVDGPALGSCIGAPVGLALAPSGDLLVADSSTNRVRQISNGRILTIAGRYRFAGDGGPAASAIMNTPTAIAIDQEGNTFIADSQNYRIRKVDKSGLITTFVGNGINANPDLNASGTAASISFVTALAVDRQSNLYFASGVRIYKISPGGRITAFAGNGVFGDTGDGEKATNAAFRSITGIAVDSESNLFAFDSMSNRIRKISAADGSVSAYAGSGARGFSGDGGLATAAALNSNSLSGLALDAAGNLYIADTLNSRIRLVTRNGLISTIAGNGVNALPSSGVPVKNSPFFACTAIAFDSNGLLYMAASSYPYVYKLDSAGIPIRISGGGSVAVAEGAIANSTVGLYPNGLVVDASGDVYLTESFNGIIHKLTVNSPIEFRATSGSAQTSPVGEIFREPLRVALTGRAGIGVSGALVTFTVISGSATLSVSNARTDASGVAGIGVTPTAPGPIRIRANLTSSNLQAVEFELTATAGGASSCSLAAPSITAVKSAGDFGGLSGFASGSWLEITGSNFAAISRVWTGNDFQGSSAPTALEGTRVTINGTAAFVYYVSPGQLNVQAPADSQTGPAEFRVTNCAGTSPAAFLEKSTRAPGLLAPASFISNGRQYVAALFQDGATFAGTEGLIAGVPFRPAKPGDSITLYGIGFGPVTPDIRPGVIAQTANSLADVSFTFGDVPAALTFAGLAPGNIGLYQFNLTIPDLPSGDSRLTVAVGGHTLQQALYLTIGR